MRGHVESSIVASVGKYNERWRFKHAEPISLRGLSSKFICAEIFRTEGYDKAEEMKARLLSRRNCAHLSEVLDVLNPECFIPLVPRSHSAFLGTNWRTCVSCPWKRKEHISVLEVRACVAALCVCYRRISTHRHRSLFLSDSIACILSSGKGAKLQARYVP